VDPIREAAARSPDSNRRQVHRAEQRRASRGDGPIAGAQTRRGGRNKFYQFTAIDDCTRLRVLRIYPKLNQKTAIKFVDYVLQRLPFQVEVIQTDNGCRWVALSLTRLTAVRVSAGVAACPAGVLVMCWAGRC
jgi:hypothetical protein